jgi:hypothetical protein
VVCDRKDAELIFHHGVDDAEGETSSDKATLPMTPNRPKPRMLEQQCDGMLEFREEGP